MIFTRTEWNEMLARQSCKRDAERAPHYKAMVQAEIGVKQVTSSPAWNGFLQILSAKKAEVEEKLALLESTTRSSNDFSHEWLANIQASRRSMQQQIETYAEVMDLPAEIIDNSQRAQEKLESLKHAETNGKSDSSAAS